MGVLRKTARRNARLQYAPVLRDLGRQGREARQTFRMGRRQARADARDISNAALAAVPQVRKDYRYATREMRFADELGGDVGEGTFAEADALSRRQTLRGLAQSMAAEKGDLRARAVRAQEAAAYGTQSLFDTMQSALKDIGQERTATKREQGQFALAELQRLQEEREAQHVEQARLAAEQQRIAISEANLRLSQRRERHMERERRYDRKHPSKSGGGDTVHSQTLKQQIIDARAEYERQIQKDVPLAEIAKDARKKGVSEVVLNAASSLATKGYIPGNGVAELRASGVRGIPKSWRG